MLTLRHSLYLRFLKHLKLFKVKSLLCLLLLFSFISLSLYILNYLFIILLFQYNPAFITECCIKKPHVKIISLGPSTKYN